jgi:DNA-binding response OmpR family regulator
MENTRFSEAEVFLANLDLETEVALEYFFSTILKKKTVDFHSLSGLKKVCKKEYPRKILIVGDSAKSKSKYELIQGATNLSAAPLVVSISANDSKQENVSAFLAGADDVIRRPFSLLELGLRINARLDGGLPRLKTIEAAEIVSFEAEAFISKHAGLTPAETKIAHILLQNSGNSVSRDRLSQEFGGGAFAYGLRTFDVHISSIRKKLKIAFGTKIEIKAVRSKGYLLQLKNEVYFEPIDHPKSA